MAGEPPIYESGLRAPEGPRGTIAPVNAPVPDLSGIGDAFARLGSAGTDFAVKLAAAQIETQDAAIKSKYLTGIAGLRDTWAGSEDYANAPAQFETERGKLERDLLAGVPDPKRRAALGLYFTVHGLEAKKQVDQKALANEGDANVAGLNTRSAEYVRKAASAGSPDERAAIIESWNADVDRQVGAGWISRADGVKRKITGEQTLDDADALALIRMNPRQALEELQNPERFPALAPLQRENLINQAKAANDSQQTLAIQNVGRRDPVRAIGIVGRIGALGEGDGVFDRGIIPIESGGKADAKSPAGALGLSQLMPDTARKQARALGLADVAALSDAALEERLLKDPVLNRALGLAEWRSLLARYDGRIYAAAAAYNAGPGNAGKPRADAWVAEAERRYGPNFSPAELAEVIPIAETRNYVLKLADTLGAPRGGPGLSTGGSYHAANAVSAIVAQHDNERISAIKAIAAVGRETEDPATLFKAGYTADPARYAGWRQKQIDAAAAGDMTAAKAVREADFQRELLPFRQQALRTPPAQLEALVQSESARLAGSAAPSIDDKNRLDVARETLKSVVQARRDNIIGLAEEAQLVPAADRVAIDGRANPASQEFARSLALRGAQANAAARFYDGTANALKPQELAAVKERWSNAGPDEQFRLLQAFGRHLDGRAYGDTLAAVIGSEANAEIVGRVARERPEIARDILVGAKLMATKEVNDKAALVRPALASKLGGQVFPDPSMQDEVVNAALALYTARRGATGSLYDPTDSAGIEKAIEEITGPIVKRNGRRTPIAPGITPRAFGEALDHLTEREVTLMGGAYGRNAAPIAAREIADRAQLVPLAPASPRYAVLMPTPDGKGAPVLTYDGLPLIFDMRTIARSVVVPLTRYQVGVRTARGAAWERMRQANEEALP